MVLVHIRHGERVLIQERRISLSEHQRASSVLLADKSILDPDHFWGRISIAQTYQ